MGAQRQKQLLRLTGACIGGLMGLASIIYLVVLLPLVRLIAPPRAGHRPQFAVGPPLTDVMWVTLYSSSEPLIPLSRRSLIEVKYSE